MSNKTLAAALCATMLAMLPTQPLRGEELWTDADRGYSPGTLMQWSYGNSFSGGPDLSEPIVTDRPDFTEASSTVGRRVAQLEMGYTYTYDEEAGVVTKGHSIPETLLRVGILAEWLELRAGYNHSEESQVAGGAGAFIGGEEDVYLGLKIGLTPQEGILPEMALVPQLHLPSGSEGLPGVNWLYGWDVNDFISTAGSTQFNRAIDATTNASYTEWIQTWTIGYSLADKLGAYTEWFALFPSSADTAKPEHYFDGGFTYLISNDIQWDIRGGVGLNDAADDYFVGTGLSIRFQ